MRHRQSIAYARSFSAYIAHVYIGFGLVLVQHENGEKRKIFSVTTFQGLSNTHNRQMAIRWISCTHSIHFFRHTKACAFGNWRRPSKTQRIAMNCSFALKTVHWSYRQLKIFHASWTHPSRKFHAMLCSVRFGSVLFGAVLCIWITHSAHSCLCRIGQALRWA